MSCSRCGRSAPLRQPASPIPSVISRPGTARSGGWASNPSLNGGAGYQPTFSGHNSISQAIMGMRYVPK